jgi:hypothetical protein
VLVTGLKSTTSSARARGWTFDPGGRRERRGRVRPGHARAARAGGGATDAFAKALRARGVTPLSVDG